MGRAAIFAAWMMLIAGCLAVAVGPTFPAPTPDPIPAPVPAQPPTVTWARVLAPGDVVGSPPPAGSWRLHLIDVGTGLALLVQGPDFTLLYDAGSNDPAEKPDRVVAYLTAALGSSGDAQCGGDAAPTGLRRPIDHVILSHPHQDHASALELVLHCFAARHVWDSGRVNDAVFYRDFLIAVGGSAGVAYHTAAPPPADRTRVVKDIAVTFPPAMAWDSFSEGDTVALGDDAGFTILHAEPEGHADPNGNSIVLLLELGGARLLLTGDAESGARADPSAVPGDVEEHLLDHFAAAIDVDILQVGHHGSKTSSRRAFLDAVSPSLALISAGPRSYKGTRLPDPEVLEALAAVGATVLRTDEHDETCDIASRLGRPTGPGGCDSWIVTIAR